MPALALYAALLLPAAAPAQDNYTVTDLGALGYGYSKGYAINEDGDVAGYTLIPAGDSHAFFWSNGIMTDAGALPGYSWGLGWGINSADQVVGESGLKAFQWSAGAGIQAINGTGSSSWAWDVNDQGVIAGEGEDSNYNGRAFIWKNGTVTFLGTGTDRTGAYAINEKGEIVGYLAPAGSWSRATMWDAQGTAIDLNSPGNWSVARDLNESGQVVGASNFPSAGTVKQAFLWENGAMISLGALAGSSYPESEAFGVNSSGQVVGWSDNPNGYQPDDHAFLWENGVMRDLNDLIPLGSGWELIRAHGINDAGQICGYGTYQGSTRAFRLEPERQEFTLSGPTPGTAGTVNTLQTVNGTPDAIVFFIYGFLPGQTWVTGCPNLFVDMMPPIWTIARVRADANGATTLNVPVPAAAAGRRVRLQAVGLSVCELSNLVIHRF